LLAAARNRRWIEHADFVFAGFSGAGVCIITVYVGRTLLGQIWENLKVGFVSLIRASLVCCAIYGGRDVWKIEVVLR